MTATSTSTTGWLTETGAPATSIWPLTNEQIAQESEWEASPW